MKNYENQHVLIVYISWTEENVGNRQECQLYAFITRFQQNCVQQFIMAWGGSTIGAIYVLWNTFQELYTMSMDIDIFVSVLFLYGQFQGQTLSLSLK